MDGDAAFETALSVAQLPFGGDFLRRYYARTRRASGDDAAV